MSVNNPAAIRSWERAKGWIGSISPAAVVAYRERDSMGVFDSGNAAFNRLWLGTSNARSVPFSEVRWRNGESHVPSGFTRIPGGPRAQAGTMGGSGLAVSLRSAHPREALRMVQFRISQRGVRGCGAFGADGKEKAAAAAATLEQQLVTLTGYRTGPPKNAK